MKRIKSKLTLTKKRIKAVHSNAKWAGFFYLLGTIALAAAGLVFPLVDNSFLAGEGMPIMNAIALVSALDFAALDSQAIVRLVMLAVYFVASLILVVNVLRSLGKLGWLYKKRASYMNGFNRNMYAMDDMSKFFGKSFAALINSTIIIFVGSARLNPEAALSMMGIIVLAAGLVIHFLVGLIEGKVTLFTTGDRVEEEKREYGLGLFFLRSLFQVIVTGAIVYFFVANNGVGNYGVIYQLTEKPIDFNAILATEGLVPFAVELVAWLFVFGLVSRAVSAKEFNRLGMEGPGVKAYRAWTFFVFVIVAALAVLNGMNVNLFIVAGIAFVGFILDCCIYPHYSNNETDYEYIPDEYFHISDEMAAYNNTII